MMVISMVLVFSVVMLIIVLIEWESIQQRLLDPLVLSVRLLLQEWLLQTLQLLRLSRSLRQNYLHIICMCLTVP